MMAPDLHFNHARRNIRTSTTFEVNTAGELILTDQSTHSLAERNIAHNVLITLLNLTKRRDSGNPIIGADFTVSELGTNASDDNRRFKIIIRPPFTALAIEILKDCYYIDESEINGLG